jgi:hypothetical protein
MLWSFVTVLGLILTLVEQHQCLPNHSKQKPPQQEQRICLDISAKTIQYRFRMWLPVTYFSVYSCLCLWSRQWNQLGSHLTHGEIRVAEPLSGHRAENLTSCGIGNWGICNLNMHTKWTQNSHRMHTGPRVIRKWYKPCIEAVGPRNSFFKTK